MGHTNEWDALPAWRRRQEERQRQQEGERRYREQVVQTIAPLPLRVTPRPWEDLASLLRRTAGRMGYEWPHWLLHPEHIGYRIEPVALPVLRQRTDYLFLQRLLLVEEEQLYRTTLHALSDRFQLQQAGKADFALFGSPSPEEISRPLLRQEHSLQHFEADKYMRVCPLCLDEPEGYDRLYWRCKLTNGSFGTCGQC